MDETFCERDAAADDATLAVEREAFEIVEPGIDDRRFERTKRHDADVVLAQRRVARICQRIEIDATFDAFHDDGRVARTDAQLQGRVRRETGRIEAERRRTKRTNDGGLRLDGRDHVARLHERIAIENQRDFRTARDALRVPRPETSRSVR